MKAKVVRGVVSASDFLDFNTVIFHLKGPTKLVPQTQYVQAAGVTIAYQVLGEDQ